MHTVNTDIQAAARSRRGRKPVNPRKPGYAIQEYIDRHGLDRAQFGALIGVSEHAVAHWILTPGRHVPAEKVGKIVEVTDGEIQDYQLRPDIFAAPAQDLA